MFCAMNIGEEGQSVLTIILLLVPAALYVMGLMEGKAGRYFFLTGIFFHALSIIQRGMTIGTIPLTEKHDNISFMAFAMAISYWYFFSKKDMKDLGLIALPVVSAITIVSAGFTPIDTISPFLKTPWFYLHMFFFFLSYAVFGISACIGLLYLFKGGSEHETLQYKGASYGWIIFSISLVIGSIWFFIAYGTYWLWTSKELWTTLTWFYYGLYLHARYIKGLSGRPAAAIGCVGFFVALFAYFGVGTIIPSPPTQF